MHSPELSRARSLLYPRIIQQTISSVSALFGLRITTDLINAVFDLTKPLIDSGRELARDLAYEDYLEIIEDPIVEPIELNRFTDELWEASLDKVFEDKEFFDEEALEEIAMSADYWSRDAEFGQKIAIAKGDDRVGRVARVDPEPPSCAFCTLLNSRGPVYLTEETALRTLHKGDECEIVFVPAGTEDDYPGKESVDLAKEAYIKATKGFREDSSTSAILKRLKEQNPDRAPGRIKSLVSSSVESVKSQSERNQELLSAQEA